MANYVQGVAFGLSDVDLYHQMVTQLVPLVARSPWNQSWEDQVCKHGALLYCATGFEIT